MSVMSPRQPDARSTRPTYHDSRLTARRGALARLPISTIQLSRGQTAVIVVTVLAVVIETLLLLTAVVPTSIWAAHGFPDGPIPAKLYPVAAVVFYVLPTATGALCRRWPVAVALATLPAWVDLAAFAVAASPKVGPFYVVFPDHAINTVGTLELFAIMGALGWLGRTAVLELLGRGERRGS